MEEKIKLVEGLIKEVSQEEYSPYRDVAIGGLRTFVENAKEHARLQAGKVKKAAPAAK